MCRVSVIMAVHNGAAFLKDCIDSVLSQSFINFEFIIVNDGSTDNSPAIIKKFANQDQRIKIINKEHTGLANSLNIGIKKAQGEFIARIDADDIWLPEKLGQQIQYLNFNPNKMLLGSSVVFIDERGALVKAKGFNNGEFLEYEQIIKGLTRNNLFCHSSVVFRKELVLEIGYFDENFVSSLDYDYWVRIVSRFPATILAEPLVKYRITEGMQSIQLRRLQIKETIRVQKIAFQLLKDKKRKLFFFLQSILNMYLSLFIFEIKKFGKGILKILF